MTINMEKPYVVGMDIGGTNTVFGVVDLRGNVLAFSFCSRHSNMKTLTTMLMLYVRNFFLCRQQFGGAAKNKRYGQSGALTETIIAVLLNLHLTCLGKESFLWLQCLKNVWVFRLH